MVELQALIGTVSVSRLETAQRCLAKFFYDYVAKRPRRFGVHAQFGNAADATANEVYTEKRERGDTPTKADVQDRFAAQWEFESQAVDDWGDETKGRLLDIGVGSMGLWRERIAQHVVPLAAQEEFVAKVTDPISNADFNLRCYVDLRAEVKGKQVIADLKTSEKAYAPAVFAHKMQPAAYTLVSGITTFQYHVMRRTTTPATQIIGCELPDSARTHFLRVAGMIRRQIGHAFATGDWLPNRSHFLCSRRWCDHWQVCQREHGGVVAP